MHRLVWFSLLILGWFLSTLPAPPAWAGDAVPPPDEPFVADASPDAENALAVFELVEGLQGALFAAEPLVANPVAFFVDPHGRIYVCESFRQDRGVTDNRAHGESWLKDDLAAMTVEDRRAFHKKHLGDAVREYMRHDDRIRVLADTTGDGRADQSTVFADGFNDLVEGTGAGVLVRDGDVYFACIPNLWLLRDETGDGKADRRTSLHYGYGVRVAFRGHDLHGLTMGPDGMLYFTIGDRGFHVETEQGTLADPETGAVFRCELDGSGLEVLATGLRNPQDLAFDEYGNLFTADNDSDSGDLCRWIYVVEGSDYGWRMSYQYLADRGPYNREKIWHPYHAEQPAYIAPPVANIADGPAGLDYYPGTGFSDYFQGRFLLCDFRGTPTNSGIRSFRVRPDGAFFELIDRDQPIWKILATHIQFGPDGHIYVSDWVDGWTGEGKGRIYRFFDPELVDSEEVREVQSLLSGDWFARDEDELAELLGHADRRVRMEAQFELARRNSVEPLLKAALHGEQLLVRLHGLWGLGQIARQGKSPQPELLDAIAKLLGDDQPEVRAQAASLLGRLRFQPAAGSLIRLMSDSEPRVRFFATMAISRLGDPASLPEVVALLEENADSDPILRHAGIMALTSIGGRQSLESLFDHPHRSVRLAVVVALRRLGDPAVAHFLNDADTLIVREAAGAIHDELIQEALPALADLIGRPTQDDALLRRVLNANFRLATQAHADAVAQLAARSGAPPAMREEALDMLADWAQPDGRDRVLGIWRPLEPRSPSMAVDALRPALPGILAAEEAVRNRGLQVAAQLGIREVGPALVALVRDGDEPAGVRADALRALGALDEEEVVSVLDEALQDSQGAVRAAARDVLVQVDADRAVPLLATSVEEGETVERQAALAALSALDHPAAGSAVEAALQRLLEDQIPADTRLDVVQAALARDDDSIGPLLDRYYENLDTDGPAVHYREALYGGNAESGRRIFFERTQVGCVRCHKVDGVGGEVGPDLSRIGAEKSRQYLLEAIVEPNNNIAEGFESVMVADDLGRVHVGVVREETDDHLQLITAEGHVVTIEQDAIEARREAQSAMPADLIEHLTPAEVRDLVEFLAQQGS